MPASVPVLLLICFSWLKSRRRRGTKIQNPEPNTFFIATFGCKVNQYDTQLIREQLKSAGMAEVSLQNFPDYIIVNTCSVTGAAEAKARRMVMRLARTSPKSIIVAAGCMAERSADALKKAGAAIVVGNAEKSKLASMISEAEIGQMHGISQFAGHSRAFVKVQDGCDAYCSYCIVPSVRGKPVSRPMKDAVDEVKRLSERFNEIVVTGVHVGLYRDESGATLYKLLCEMLDRTPVRRIRLSSIEMGEVSAEILSLAAQTERFCPHFHIPLQSGSDNILKVMNRRYTSGEFIEKVKQIKAALDCPSITTDVIVGFPGENEFDFCETIRVSHEAGFGRMHVFPFSPRPGTPAASMKRCPSSTATTRMNELLVIAGELAAKYQRSLIGRAAEALVESKRDSSGKLCGYSERYMRVVFDGPDELAGQLVKVQMLSLGAGGLDGQIIS